MLTLSTGFWNKALVAACELPASVYSGTIQLKARDHLVNLPYSAKYINSSSPPQHPQLSIAMYCLE